MKILIVEDDMVLAGELVLLCSKWGFEAEYIKDFQNIAVEFDRRRPDLVLMDINLPFYDGFYWCGQIRERSDVPVLFLSSRDQNADKVMGMAAGGDDYIEKPFDTELLLVKIRSMLRRAYEYKSGTSNSKMYITDKMYYEMGVVCCQDLQVELTRSESRIMEALLAQKGKVVSREKLMMILWKTDEFVTDASLTVLISRLRAKLREIDKDEAGTGGVIETKKGIGYYIS